MFSDEDLRRLKLRLSADYFVRNKFVDAQDMEALIARLEAAERVCQQSELYVTQERAQMFRFKDLLSAWRKSAGREEK